jgi:prepilin-type processing-associated H-X9-DG protein
MDSRRIRIKDVTDGLTYTIALGESAGRTDSHRYWGDGDHSFTHHGDYVNFVEIKADGTRVEKRKDEMFSDHPGGVHIAMGDGRVQFLSETTSKKVLDFLATRAGGELLHGDF